MGVALGSIDGRFRPLLRIRCSNGGDEILALLDTGFNGERLCDRIVAAEIGTIPSGRSDSVELAGHIKSQAQVGHATILWLGQPRQVRVLVSMAPPARHVDGEPVAIVGGALLAPSLVLLDYAAMTVEIEAQE